MSEMPKVLVVDDDRRMVRTICDILKLKGCEVESAYSGEEAAGKVKLGGLDCVLMDIKMPGIDGVESLKMLKAVSPGLPVVLMSAYATCEQREEAKRNGAVTVLNKPIDFQQVLSFLSLLKKEESILIVDDDPEFSRTLKDILQSTGYHVKTEEDPEKALAQMEQEYLVVILDLKLGAADGLDVLKKVLDRYPEKPVVLVTGCRDEISASIEHGMHVGAYTLLYKPFDMDKLIRIIEDISRCKRNTLLGEPFDFGVI